MYRLPAGITRDWPQEKERKAMVTTQAGATQTEYPGIFADCDTETRLKCPGCDIVYEVGDDALEKIYECNSCGNLFNRSESDYDSHRCNCGKFAAKAFDGDSLGCPDACHEELEEVEGAECPQCGDFVLVEDFAEHSAECGITADPS